MLLADFGADVVKIEQPGTGDPLRKWTSGGRPLWWNVYARGKRYVTLNIQAPQGKELLLKMAPRFDGCTNAQCESAPFGDSGRNPLAGRRTR